MTPPSSISRRARWGTAQPVAMISLTCSMPSTVPTTSIVSSASSVKSGAGAGNAVPSRITATTDTPVRVRIRASPIVFPAYGDHRLEAKPVDRQSLRHLDGDSPVRGPAVTRRGCLPVRCSRPRRAGPRPGKGQGPRHRSRIARGALCGAGSPRSGARTRLPARTASPRRGERSPRLRLISTSPFLTLPPPALSSGPWPKHHHWYVPARAG